MRRRTDWMGREMEFPVLASVCSGLCRTLCDLMDCSPHQAPQAPLSMGFSRQEYWNGLPFPPPGGSSQPRNQTHLSCLSCIGRQTLYHLSHLGSLVLWLEKGRGSKVPVTLCLFFSKQILGAKRLTRWFWSCRRYIILFSSLSG